MTSTEKVKAATPAIVNKYSGRSNRKAFVQILNTLGPYFLLFYLAIKSVSISYWLTAACVIVLSFFILRIFVLMHDCGHKSLFKTPLLNTVAGFITGVITGMPQYVWSEHHNYHHRTNGNWEKYRGPLGTLSLNEYEQLSPSRKKIYTYFRNIMLAPLGAFMYFIFNPRVNWLAGSLKFGLNVMLRKIKHPRESLKKIIAEQESRVWKTGREYLHMMLNNIVLLSIWAAACWYFGAIVFFSIYIISLSFAGAAGLIIFTVQHNFEGSYASNTEHCDYYRAAMEGTSFLTLPKWINWFCADIVYHHIHHLSAGIPNYNLARCHKEYAYLFEDVKRITFRDIAKSFTFIIWDEDNQRIISIP